MRKLPFVPVVVLLFLISGAVLQAQILSPSTYAYPLPGKASDPPVLCTTCVGTTKDLPTWPYSLPIKRFVGRFLDSSRARDVQSPVRTLRARDARAVPANGRLYVVFGGSRFVAWNLSTFFTSDLGKPLNQIQPPIGPVGSYNNTPELYLPYPAFVDADNDGNWATITVDGQNRLGGFDWDDRGYVYLAYGPYGWGIVKDLQPAGLSFVSQITDTGNLVPPNNIQVLRSGSTYYALIMNPTGSSQTGIFDVTNASAAAFVGYVNKAPNNFEKIPGAQEDIFGTVAQGTQNVEIYTTSQFVSGRTPAKTITPSSGLYWDITTDGTNFYAMHGIGSNQSIDIISPATPGDPASYAVTRTYLIPNGANAGELRWGGGYLTLSSRDSQNAYDIRLFKVTNGDLKDIDLAKFFQKYYTLPPAGYAKPDSNTSLFDPSFVYSAGGHDYLVFEAYGMGDVFELQTGESVDISLDAAAGYGTANPNAPSTVGPYYCDPITFSSVASSPMALNWDFGNPESVGNSATSLSGSPVVHQFAGLTTAAQIQAGKTVTATDAADPEVSDTQPVTMLVPSARVGISGTATYLQSNVAASAMVTGDLFVDASDGSVEGHYDAWTIDGTTTTGTPVETRAVGGCGAHTLAYDAHYVPYTGSGSSITPLMSPSSHFVAGVSNVSYDVKPFIAALAVASYDGSTVTFRNTSRMGSASTFATGAQWSEHLQFLDAAGAVVLDVPAKSAAVGTQDSFAVTKSLMSAAKRAVLTVSVDNAMIADPTCTSAVAGAVSATAELPIAIPDPTIAVSGCGYVGSPCTLTAGSSSTSSMSGWAYQWTLNTAPSATTAVFSPVLSAPGTYSIVLIATNAFGSATASKTLSVQAPLCTGVPSNLSFSWSCTTCSTGSAIKFTPFAFSPYAFQDCDSFNWTFGDGQSSNLKTPTHQYSSDGLYTVKLTVTNTNGSTYVTSNVQVGNVSPSCPTAAPSNIYASFSAPSGCSAANPNCRTAETISFAPAPWGYTLQTCDEFLWNFGDGSNSTSKNATHVYASPGTYPVTLQVSNDKGASTSAVINVVITADGSCASAPGPFNGFSFSGGTSKCSSPSTPCSIAEAVTFTAVPFQDTFRACDTFQWDFGDGSAVATGKTVTHAFSRIGTFPVKMTISNALGSMNAVVNVQIGGGGGTPPPEVDFTVGDASPTVGAPVAFSGTILSGTVDTWSWDFGDGSTGGGQNVSHVYATAGVKSVTLTASNSGGSAVAAKSITVADAKTFALLLPVVTHLDNADGSKWQTDLHFFNQTPNFDPSSPMTLSFEYGGRTTTLTFDKATVIKTDFLRDLSTEAGTGSVIVRGTGDVPQMWTRTYIVMSSGVGTYGQLIPAVPLTTVAAAGEGAPRQYLPGVQFGPKGSSSKFRTNIGLINPTSASATFSMSFLGSDGLQIGNAFDTTVQPFSLVQVNDGQIRGAVPELVPGTAYTAVVTSATSGIIAYASIVDNTSNDPVYVQAVSETEATRTERKVQVLPGLAHVGDWRSDMNVFNADGGETQFDMEYLAPDGSTMAEEKGVTLGSRKAMELDDVLGSKCPGCLATLRLTTNVGSSFPILFSRTYNDRATDGTFGQGIPAFSGTEGNASVGKPAFIAGVRSNSSYYTNLGLVSASSSVSNVSVKMLDPIRGTVIGEQTYTVNPGQSMIVGSANADFLHTLAPTMGEDGTLEIEVTSGGNVWGFASIIDKLTKDPEYVPATAAP